MTYIRPQRKKYWLFNFILIIIIFVSFSIYFYNQISSLRCREASLKKEILKQNQRSLELKQEVYNLTNPVYLEKVAQEQGLILNSSPNYLSRL